MMRTPIRRRFTVLDGMILIGATAVGLGASRYFHQNFGQFAGENWGVVEYLLWVRDYAPAWLAAWTLAFFAIRLIPPRPDLRHIFIEPGMVASSAATSCLTIRFLPLASSRFSREMPYWLIGAVDALLAVPPSVTGAWTILLLSGRWRSRSNWIDRAGRLLGIGWVLLFFISSYFDAFIYPRVVPQPHFE